MVYVNGKGWRRLGSGAGGRKNVDVGMILGTVTPSTAPIESSVRMKVVGLASLVAHCMLRSQLLQTAGHPERDQSH